MLGSHELKQHYLIQLECCQKQLTIYLHVFLWGSLLKQCFRNFIVVEKVGSPIARSLWAVLVEGLYSEAPGCINAGKGEMLGAEDFRF